MFMFMSVYFCFLHFQQHVPTVFQTQHVLLWVIQVDAYAILDSIRMYQQTGVFQWQPLTQQLTQ